MISSTLHSVYQFILMRTQFVNDFLSQSKAGDDIQTPEGPKAYDEEQYFHLVTKRDFVIDEHTQLWTYPPVQISGNEFLHASVDDLVHWIDRIIRGAPGWWREKAFVVLDKRSMEDKTALLVNSWEDFSTETVRCRFDTILEAARNHSENLKPDVFAMLDAQDENGVDTIYKNREELFKALKTSTARPPGM